MINRAVVGGRWPGSVSMLSHEVRDFKKEVGDLEDVATRVSEQTLRDQEQRFNSAINEITQSITSMSHDNDLVMLHGDEVGNTDTVVINPSRFGERINEFDKLIELLKMTHLEQETLDFFLRYTISSADLLQLKTTQDPQYVELDNSVRESEHDIDEAHHRWIDDTKLQISRDAEKLAKDQDIVNELYLETADILEDCENLIMEVEKLREEKEGHKAQAERERTPIAAVHEEWEEIRRYQNDFKHLETQIAQLEMIKKDFELKETAKKLKTDPKLNQLGCALDSLIKLWISNFLPSSGWRNLEVYPQIKKFQFDVPEAFTILIALDDRHSIGDITVYRKENSGIRVDEGLQSDLKQQNVGSRDIYKSMEKITGYLQDLPPPVK